MLNVESWAFYKAQKLKTIKWAGNQYPDNTWPPGVPLNDLAFCCAGITSIVFSDGITEITSAFAGCPITEIIIPQSVKKLAIVENNYYGMPENAPEFFALQHDPHPEKGDGFVAFRAKYEANVAGCANAKLLENTAPLLPDKGHCAMLNGFIRAIREDLPSPCDEIAGFRATYLAQRAIEALESKRTLSVPVEKITPCIG